MDDFNIFLMRHGKSAYTQGKVSLEEACDIVEDARPRLQMSAVSIYDIAGKAPDIISSPYGRALASAKVVHETLGYMNAHPKDIQIEKDLEEIRNFDYKILNALARGKTLEIDGNKYEFDIKKTNPRMLSEVQFFRQDIMHDSDYLSKLPKDIQSRIKDFETCRSAERRLDHVLDKIKDDSILMTHEGPLGRYVVQWMGMPDAFLDRGGFIQLENYQGIWTPITASGLQMDTYNGKDI